MNDRVEMCDDDNIWCGLHYVTRAIKNRWVYYAILIIGVIIYRLIKSKVYPHERRALFSTPVRYVHSKLNVRLARNNKPAVLQPENNKQEPPSTLALQPCRNSKAAVASLLIELPGSEGKGGGLAVGSALVTHKQPSIFRSKKLPPKGEHVI